MSEIDSRLAQIFMPQYLQRTEEIQGSKKKLVHYTSASTALSILKNKEIWMRNTRCMNDFLEVRYGISFFAQFCQKPEYSKLKEAFGKQGEAFSTAMALAIEDFDKWTNTTYICCFSEHEKDEDQLGRLSMWRGYGTDSGIAMVLKSDSFVDMNGDFQVFTAPVEYLDKAHFNIKMNEFIERVDAERKFLEDLPKSVILGWVTNMIKREVVSIKHPGFKEEKEWRVIADYETCKGLRQDTIAVNGIPQLVMKLPLTDEKVNSEKGFSISANLDHVIIGPTPYPAVIGKALAIELANCKVDDPWSKIKASDIPYRARI